jgi:hypothetical protein
MLGAIPLLVCMFMPNHIDYPIAMWAVHRLGAAVSYVVFYFCVRGTDDAFTRPANPSYTEDELSTSGLFPHAVAALPGTPGRSAPPLLSPPCLNKYKYHTDLTDAVPRSLPAPSLGREITPDLRRLPANRACSRGEDGDPARTNCRVRRPQSAAGCEEGALPHCGGADSDGVDEQTRV